MDRPGLVAARRRLRSAAVLAAVSVGAGTALAVRGVAGGVIVLVVAGAGLAVLGTLMAAVSAAGALLRLRALSDRRDQAP